MPELKRGKHGAEASEAKQNGLPSINWQLNQIYHRQLNTNMYWKIQGAALAVLNRLLPMQVPRLVSVRKLYEKMQAELLFEVSALALRLWLRIM